MKKILAAALVAALSLTACGGNDEPQPRETVYVEQKVPQTNSSSEFTPTEEEFLFDVSEHMTPALHDSSQDSVVELGRAICGAFDSGAGIEDIISVGTDNGLTYEDTVVIAAAAVVNFCPEHRGTPSISNMT